MCIHIYRYICIYIYIYICTDVLELLQKISLPGRPASFYPSSCALHFVCCRCSVFSWCHDVCCIVLFWRVVIHHPVNPSPSFLVLQFFVYICKEWMMMMEDDDVKNHTLTHCNTLQRTPRLWNTTQHERMQLQSLVFSIHPKMEKPLLKRHEPIETHGVSISIRVLNSCVSRLYWLYLYRRISLHIV